MKIKELGLSREQADLISLGEDAAEAKQHLNHTIIGGREIRIVFAEENRKTPQEMHL